MNMVNPIRPISKIVQSAGNTVKRVTPSSVQARFIERATFFPMTNPIYELSLASLILLGFFYRQGRSERSGETPKTYFKEAAQIGVEALITASTVQSIRGLYPTVTLAKMVYDMGRAQNNSQRTEAIIKNTSVSASGYLGIYSGQFLTDFLHRRDAAAILRYIDDPALKPFMAHSSHNTPSFANAVEALKKEATRFSKADFNSEGIKELTSAFESAQNKLLDHIGQVKSLDKLNSVEPLQKLIREVKLSRSAGILRWLNPAFGYILGIALIGLPAAKAIIKSGEDTKILSKGTWQERDHRPMLWLPFVLNQLQTDQPQAPQDIMEV